MLSDEAVAGAPQVHDDVRLRQNAQVEKDESHAGKIVERHWCARARADAVPGRAWMDPTC
jgi:hypothetical protein